MQPEGHLTCYNYAALASDTNFKRINVTPYLVPMLHVFLDESGDLGFKNDSSARFILSFVFHDTCDDIGENLRRIEQLDYVHVGPLIRNEEFYKDKTLEERIKIFRKFFAFFVGLPIKCKSFIYDKGRFANSRESLEKRIRDDLSGFFSVFNPYFSSSDSVAIYYDRGLRAMGKILEEVLDSSGLIYSFKEGVKADHYRLFQVADLITFVKLLDDKLGNEGMSSSESRFFEKPRRFKKYYVKGVEKKEI